MHERRTLEMAFENFESEIANFLPKDSDRRKVMAKIVELSLELHSIKLSIEKDPFLKNAATRYFGLDPLKISALNLAHALESDEERFLRLQFDLTYKLILVNVIRLRVSPQTTRKLQSHFTGQELAHYPAARELMEHLEKDLVTDNAELQQTISALREEYEQYLFVESAHEAARSFGASSPNVRAHHSSWVAFSQFLTGLAVHVHEAEKAELIKKSRRIEAKREALFQSCAELLAKAAAGKDAKRIRRQLSVNLTEIKKVEAEIETALRELSVPGLHDYTSFIMKKDPDPSTTFELNKLSQSQSQSTGDKT